MAEVERDDVASRAEQQRAERLEPSVFPDGIVCEDRRMEAQERKHNPFINSPTGGRALSALQLPFFFLHPPAGYGVLSTTGRKTQKKRRKCIRVVREGDKAYMVAIKGGTSWSKNALANPDVRLRLPGGTFSGRARELLDPTETQQAKEAYCDSVYWFDYLTWINWRKGRPAATKIRGLLRGWFENGTRLVVELDIPSSDSGGS
jgi:deazaflavin-dependent oxidoreductase (nitroreductase family)